ncbi:MAG: hypothetical protein U5J96_12140 [Ignavibacteriaceae bacterium]|nr:hypothetical protein [Ignavibacteriaceae bacterium]
MFKKIKNIFLLVFLILLISEALYAQYIPSKERGSDRYRRQAQMEGNQIRTTVFNFGMTGRQSGVPIYEQTPYEWPKNTGQVYLAVAGILVGAEVVDDLGQTLHIRLQMLIIGIHLLGEPVISNL